MQKHLPGQHDQKTHGRSLSPWSSPRNTLFLSELDNYGLDHEPSTDFRTMYVRNGLFNAGLTLPSADILNVEASCLAGPFSTSGDFSLYTPAMTSDYINGITLLEGAAKDHGFKYIRLPIYRMPVALAAKNGYHLSGLGWTDTNRLAHDAVHYIAQVYDVKETAGTKNDAANQLNFLAETSPYDDGRIKVADLLKLRYPDLKDIPLYTEFLMQNTWRPVVSNAAYYIKELNK